MIETMQAPPQNLTAEMNVLGACLQNEAALDRTAEHLTPEDFYVGAHQKIYRVMLILRAAGTPVDSITVSDALRERGMLEDVSGPSYLLHMEDQTVSTANVGYYAAIVRNTRQRRALLEFFAKGTDWVHQMPDDVGEIQDRIETEILAIGKQHGEPIMGIDDVVKEATALLVNGSGGVPYHLRQLSKYCTMSPGLYSLIIGVRSMGKSRFAFGEIIHKCKRGTPVLLFSVEMDRKQVVNAITAIELGIPLRELRWTASGHPEYVAGGDYARVAAMIAGWPLTIEHRPDTTVQSMAATTRRWNRDNRNGLVIVDFAQRIMSPGRNPMERYAYTAEGVAKIARDVDVPIVLMSQATASKEADGSVDTHSRGSLEFEIYAENVIGLNRPGKRAEEGTEVWNKWHGKAEVTITKNRFGDREGTIVCGWREGIGCFCDLEGEQEIAPAHYTVSDPEMFKGEDGEISYGDPFD